MSLVKLNPHLFWSAILVATAGNTLGGAVSWWMGLLSHRVVDRYGRSSSHRRALAWLEQLGPNLCWPGCRWSATPCVRWQAGSSCRFGLVCCIWQLANLAATWS